MNIDNSVRNTQIIKVMVVISGIILILAGIAMVFKNIRTEGEISIKTLVVEGSINATHVGLFLIFLGVVLELGVILKTYRLSRKHRIVQSPDLSVREREESMMYRALGGDSGEDEGESKSGL